MLLLALGLSLIVSALNVFVKDVAQIVNVFLQVGIWATPILWDVGILPEKFHIMVEYNPMWYVVNGYRESFLYFVPFWKHPQEALYCWGVCLLLLTFGMFIFKRLKPQFADVL
jgi:lipopolysaccharide transport system permease protein/teichoic acid transport system permease protein